MKALVVDGEWRPRKGYPVSAEEKRRKRALIGSQVWRNPTFEIKDVPVPNIEEDEVLVRVVACGICGSDTHLYETDEQGYIIFSGLTKLPCVLGHEFSGVVEKAGRRVNGLEEGDKIAVESVMWCGTCQACRSGAPNQCRYLELMGLSTDGAFTEYVAVKEKYCWTINELVEAYSEEDIFDIGALVEPVGCAYNGMFVVGGGFNPGATVAVYGVGPIGLGAVALARVAGASKIVAFDVIDERVKLALEMGADHSYNLESLNACSPGEKVLELTGGRGVDVQVEAAGAAPIVIPEMERALSEQGKIIYLGRAATSTPVHLDALVSGGSSIIGARGHAGYGIFPFIIRLLARGRLDLRPMIASRRPFETIIEALKESTGRRGGKILIKM
ncbi:MAG: scyllo-inosose 3-dehydrogenase [Planctomycetota bacterium]|jgi:threonine dehydrogenase-like Zn-dependent dehydrogenase